MSLDITEKNNTIEKKVKSINARVLHLDETSHSFDLQHHASGAELYLQVIRKFNILESDYFDLEYMNEDGIRCWVDHTRPLVRQISHGQEFVFRFCVKFYTPHPNLLEEEYTRYLFALQIKRDLITGILICSENTAALLGSYIVQAEIGDFIKEEYRDISYLRTLKILHEPNDDRLRRVMDFHKNHIGMSPTDADFALLDTARKVEFYGVRLHPARDVEGLPMSLSVTHLGLGVFQNLTKINSFSWAKIRKLSFRRKRFLIKLHSMDYDVIEFLFDSRDNCKRFWKKCIEHHAFFRCPLQERSRQRRPKVVTKGSSFRYIGRTQKELVRFMRENNLRRPPFERPSTARRAHPTMLTGPNYAHARMGTMSMTLRSKSADHRRQQLLDSSQIHLHGGILGGSRGFLEQVGASVTNANQLKRAHSSFVPSSANIGMATGAMATSGYSTMGGSSSGGQLAGEGLDGDGESLDRGGGREEVQQEGLITTVPPSTTSRVDFDGPPSPVATIPPAVLASTASINTSIETSAAVPSKPLRSTVAASRGQNSEIIGTSFTGALRRQTSLAERRPCDLYGQEKAEEELGLYSKQMSASALCTFGHQPQIPTQTLGEETGAEQPVPATTTSFISDSIMTTAQVRPLFARDAATGSMKFAEGLLQAEETFEETHLPPSMSLLGDTCHCKTTSTQTIPAAGDGEDGVETEDAPIIETAEALGSLNPGKCGRKKYHQHSNQSSSGRIDSIFDGGTDSSATAAQIVGIDQWSSSGTESTTGVILRSRTTAEWSTEQNEKLNLEAKTTNVTSEHTPDCLRRMEKTEKTMPPSTVLPIDTLPARPCQSKKGAPSYGFSYGFSRSIPAGVHLAGLPDAPESNPFQNPHDVTYPPNLVQERHGHLMSEKPFPFPEIPTFGFVPRHPAHSAHMLAPHNCNIQGSFYDERMTPCLYMHPLRLQDMKVCQRSHRGSGSGQHRHHHHHNRHHHRRSYHRRDEHISHGLPPPPDICCHSQPRYTYGNCNDESPSQKRSQRKHESKSLKGLYETQPSMTARRSKQQQGDLNELHQPKSSASPSSLKLLEGDFAEVEPPALPSRAHHSHRNHRPSGSPQPPTLPPKPGEGKDESQLCKIHPPIPPAIPVASKHRQTDAKLFKTENWKQTLPNAGHHHHHHCHTHEHGDQPEAPHLQKRRPVQSPTLIGEEPQSLGISSPVLGDDRSRMGSTRTSPLPPASTAKNVTASKEYMEKIGAQNASIEALRRELRSVETASSVTTITGSSVGRSIVVTARTLLDRPGGCSPVPSPGSTGPHLPPSISPSNEAAARLADASASASLGDLRNTITGNASGSGDVAVKKTEHTRSEKDPNSLLIAPQDATYLESESDSSPEQVTTDTVRRSLLPNPPKRSHFPLAGEAPKPPSLPRSSSISNSRSSESSSVVSYSRSQSLFSHGAMQSNESSLTGRSSPTDLSSDGEANSSSVSPVPEYSRQRKHHHHHPCHECAFRSHGHLHAFASSSHRSLSRQHHQRHGDFHDKKSSGKRSKSSHSSREMRPDSVLLKTLINDEIALETIAHQQKLLKRELAKQKQLAAELEEAKRRTQQLLEENSQLEKKIVVLPKKEEKEKESGVKEQEGEVISTAGSSHREHHRSSSGRRRHHHRRNKHRQHSSESEAEDPSENKYDNSKSPISERREEETAKRASYQRHSHSKGRHRRHHRTDRSEKVPSQSEPQQQKQAKEVPENSKDMKMPLQSREQPPDQKIGQKNETQVVANAEDPTESKENFSQSGEGLPPTPSPPHSPPPQQERLTATVCVTDISPLSKTTNPIQGAAEDQTHKSADQSLPAAHKVTQQPLSIQSTDETGLAKCIIKEVLKQTSKRGDCKPYSDPSSPTQSSSSNMLFSKSCLLGDHSTTELIKRAKPLDDNFVSSVDPSHHHELTGTSLEPVPEGRVAESYSLSRPYRAELSTFLDTIKNQAIYKEYEGESENSDVDVEEVDSDSTSASEGSEEIEPFPLPPAPPPDLNTADAPPQSTLTQSKRGRELHEVVSEVESGTLSELALVIHSAPLKPVTPVRLSKASVMDKPEMKVDCSNTSSNEIRTGSAAVVTPSKKSRTRRKATRQRQRSVPEMKPASDDAAEV
uniref:FERM domain-containing protein n=2 Tax=Mesocestoides corti TaxID=53468 RepID=A0A5K3EU01_MESCO